MLINLDGREKRAKCKKQTSSSSYPRGFLTSAKDWSLQDIEQTYKSLDTTGNYYCLPEDLTSQKVEQDQRGQVCLAGS